MFTQLKTGLLIIISAVLLIACQDKPDATKHVKVGTIAGPETTLMEVAKDYAEKNLDLNIEIFAFSDYSLPNAALNDGSLDANVFQHLPYLDAANKSHNYDLVAIGKTFIYPMGIYSRELAELKYLPKNAAVAIPNDPSNGARALMLLQKAKLITLKEGKGISATVHDIVENPKRLKFKELDAAQLPKVLADVDIAVINTNYAVPAGLMPTRDALFIEDMDSPYANIIVVRRGDKDKTKYQKLVAALHSKEVKVMADKLFKGQAIPAWKK